MTSPRAKWWAAFLLNARELYGYEEWFFWLTLFRTGARIGEGLALELGDFNVDDAKPYLHVHQTMSQGVGLHRQRKNVDDVTVHLRIWPSYLEEARRTRDKYEQYTGIGDQHHGAGSSRALRTV